MNNKQLQLKEYLSILGITHFLKAPAAIERGKNQSKITNYAKQTQFPKCQK
jgi:hypothetical protein